MSVLVLLPHRLLPYAILLACLTPPLWAETPTTPTPQQSPVSFGDHKGAYTEADSEEMWQALRQKYFGERPLLEGAESRVSLEAPERAEDDAAVPVRILLKKPNASAEAFRKVYLVVDVNPAPMGGLFTLTDARPLEQLNTQVRVNGYTYIRAIGETADGKLYMAKQWIKSTGAGCSAPPDVDQDEHQKRLGQMRVKLPDQNKLQDNNLLRLMISHPNNTGMQRNQLSTLLIPEHYVKQVKISFKDTLLMEAETSFTLSENPSFSFNFAPHESGMLKVEVTDSQNKSFTEQIPVGNPG